MIYVEDQRIRLSFTRICIIDLSRKSLELFNKVKRMMQKVREIDNLIKLTKEQINV